MRGRGGVPENLEWNKYNMKTINTLFNYSLTEKREEKKSRSERAELIEKILSRLNREREGTPYKALPLMAVVVKLKGVKTKELYGFIKECEQSRSFSMCFFGKLKKKTP
jgi:hypothetical protein